MKIRLFNGNCVVHLHACVVLYDEGVWEKLVVATKKLKFWHIINENLSSRRRLARTNTVVTKAADGYIARLRRVHLHDRNR